MSVASFLWAAPTTLLGLLLALVLGRGPWALVAGVLEVAPARLPRATAALTLGYVTLGRSRERLAFYRAHERVHVRQAGVWGPLFVPAYLASSAWQLLRGRDPWADNRFERRAIAAAGR